MGGCWPPTLNCLLSRGDLTSNRVPKQGVGWGAWGAWCGRTRAKVAVQSPQISLVDSPLAASCLVLSAALPAAGALPLPSFPTLQSKTGDSAHFPLLLQTPSLNIPPQTLSPETSRCEPSKLPTTRNRPLSTFHRGESGLCICCLLSPPAPSLAAPHLPLCRHRRCDRTLLSLLREAAITRASLASPQRFNCHLYHTQCPRELLCNNTAWSLDRAALAPL